MGPVVATLASLTFVLSGPILIMGRSWHMTLAIVVWVPLLLMSALDLTERPAGWRWMIGTGAVIGVYYQVGSLKLGLCHAVLGPGHPLVRRLEGDPFSALLWTVPAFLFGFALALPPLWTQFAATRDMARASGYGNGVLCGIPSFFLPYPLRHCTQTSGAVRTWPPWDISTTSERCSAPDFPLSLNLSLPMVYDIASVAGYDPLTETRPPIRFARALLAKYPAAALKAYGVRWVIVHRTARAPGFSGNRFLRGMEGVPLSGFLLSQLEALGAERVLNRPEVELWALKNSDSMAFPAEDPRHALPITLRGTGVDVNVGSLPKGGMIVVNYLWYPNARALTGGRDVRCGSDRWGRVTVEVPPGSHKVEVVLGARWGRGLANAGLVLVLSLLLAAWLSRERPMA